MAVGSRTTFKKRQKEMARVEKQRDKAAAEVAMRQHLQEIENIALKHL